ncbi:MAG: cell division protein ZapB [Acidobacteriaceae bacterium]|nr:cell division protein ZapB [Acidobacteriaceae bacterium]
MEAVQEQDIDTLSSLEERITRAVQAITTLRSENQELKERLSATESELNSTRTARDEARGTCDEFRKENGGLESRLKEAQQELEGLRGERKQVKARIEKLLGQLDLISAT